MRTSKQLQRERRQQLDEKLALSHPSNELLEDLAAQCTKDPSADQKFQYAFALSKSSNEQELHYSIAMLDSLLNSGYEHQIDCMYGSAIANYLLGEYDKSRYVSFMCIIYCEICAYLVHIILCSSFTHICMFAFAIH